MALPRNHRYKHYPGIIIIIIIIITVIIIIIIILLGLLKLGQRRCPEIIVSWLLCVSF